MKSKEFKVGLFAAAALVVLYFGFNFLRGIDFFSTTSKYYALYDNVDQLAVSNPVLVNGYAVGRVSNIKIVQELENKVLVEIDIDSDIKLGDSTKAILNSDFLGSKSIFLSIGEVTVPLQPKDTILSEVARGLFDVFAATAEPVSQNLGTTLRKLNTLLDNLTANSQHIDAVLLGMKQTPQKVNETLDEANREMGEITGTLKTLAGNVNTTLAELRPTLQNFKSLSDSLRRLELNRTLQKTEQTISKLNETFGRLNNGENTLSKLMTEDTLYVNLNTLLTDLDSLANHLNAYPKHFFAPLGKKHKKIVRDLEEAERKRREEAAERQRRAEEAKKN